jgi:TonB family protein
MPSVYWMMLIVVWGGMSPSWAVDPKTLSLLSLLTTPQPEYKISPKVDFDPSMYSKNHHIGWVIRPEVDVSLHEYQGYKRPILVEMKVIAAQGKIVEIRILKSTGSKAVDQHILRALKAAKLEPIRYADANLTFLLQHQFEVEKPLL